MGRVACFIHLFKVYFLATTLLEAVNTFYINTTRFDHRLSEPFKEIRDSLYGALDCIKEDAPEERRNSVFRK